MKDEIKKYLLDIKISIESINEFIGEKRNFFTYQDNKQLRRAIERELSIIGECVNKISKLDNTIKIDNTKYIIGIRNIIIHGYDKVDDIIVWGVISKYLPILYEEIKLMIPENF